MNPEIVQKWFADNGDLTHRLNYELDDNSIVFDLGGYEGQWSERIYNKYKCYIHIFEPIPHLYNQIVSKFANNEKIKVYNFGISDATKELNIFLSSDSSSFYGGGNDKIKCQVKSILEFIEENNITNIDLMKLNIEGDEYPVMDCLLNNNLTTIIENVQVQFHDFIHDSINLRNSIHERISKTHKITYNYEFVWENWEKIK